MLPTHSRCPSKYFANLRDSALRAIFGLVNRLWRATHRCDAAVRMAPTLLFDLEVGAKARFKRCEGERNEDPKRWPPCDAALPAAFRFGLRCRAIRASHGCQYRWANWRHRARWPHQENQELRKGRQEPRYGKVGPRGKGQTRQQTNPARL